MQMIKSILLVDDETLFHLVFDDACNILNISLRLESVSSADAAEVLFQKYVNYDKYKDRTAIFKVYK